MRTCLVLVAFVAACTCRRVSMEEITGMPVPIDKRGSETWTIDGKAYRIDATYYLIHDHQLFFLIEWSCPECDAELKEISDADAFRLASPVMRYATTHDLYRRTSVMDSSGQVLEPYGLVVAIQVHEEHGALGFRASKTHGYRVARSLAELSGMTVPDAPSGN